MSFLKNIRPHNRSVIIVSTLPDEKPGVSITILCVSNKIIFTRNYISDPQRKTYFYGCETQLIQSQVPCVFVELMDPADLRSVIADMFKYRGKSLNDKQMNLIIERS